MSGAKRILPLLAALCFALFLLYGVYFNAFGANAESMMAFFGITESRQGFVMTIQSLGGIVMTVLLGLFGERLHKLYGLLAGAVLVGVAGVTIGTMPLYGNDSYGLLLVFALIGGVGYITIDLLMNGVIADVFPEKKSTLLPIVHGFYGLGAMLAPLLVTWLTDSGRPATFAVPYLVLGAAALVLGAVFWTVSRRATPHTPYADMTALRDRSVANPTEIFRDKRAWLYLLCCFLYLCFQNGIAVWLPNYYKTVHHMAGGAANAMLTLFFLGALVVRMLSPLVYKRMPVRTFYLLTCFLSAGVFAVLLLTPSLAVQRVLLVLLGLLQGAEVPALVILCCETFPTRTASASSIIVLGVSLSALIAPTVLGRLIEQVGYGIPLWGPDGLPARCRRRCCWPYAVTHRCGHDLAFFPGQRARNFFTGATPTHQTFLIKNFLPLSRCLCFRPSEVSLTPPTAYGLCGYAGRPCRFPCKARCIPQYIWQFYFGKVLLFSCAVLSYRRRLVASNCCKI